MKRLTPILPALALPLLLSACGQGQGTQTSAAPPAAPVTVATPIAQQVVDWDEYVGRFEAVQSVDVRPRVSGYLQSINFTDGQYVRKGELLFTVDARPFEAALDQARAQQARAQAALANAQTELARSRALLAARAASQEEFESRQAAVRVAQADIRAAQAAVRAQQLNVGFTRVTAPISGRISERRVDAGNSVTADTTVLTSIISADPIHFAFEGSEALLLKYQRGSRATTGAPVRIQLQDEADFRHLGRIDFIDTGLSGGTGTIRARALVPNPGGFIKPGMFGRAQVLGSSSYQAMLVPDSAIATDGPRRIVYVVAADGTVGAKPVQPGPLSGSLRIIRSGLAPTDRVIINGQLRARPGAKVKPTLTRIVQTAAPQPTPSTTAPPASTATPVEALAPQAR